jgi:hypothetical protein
MTAWKTERPIAAETERYLAALWCEEIGIDSVGPDDTFEQVGGNSLTLRIILTKIRDHYGVLIEPKLFFQPDTSSLSQIAAELDRLLDGSR